jgi:superfamily I DNA/RNA helicase
MDRDNSQIRVIKSPVKSSALVVAPPGYGKTYLMTRRIEYLIHSGALKPPKRLLGLTFTNAAAAEMKQRVSQGIPHRKLHNIDLSTIHSFCYQVLYSYGTYISISQEFSIISESEVKSLLDPIASNHNIDFDADFGKVYRSYRNWIIEHLLKNNDMYEDPHHNSSFRNIYQKYIEHCRKQNKLDFDHVLTSAHKLFIEHPKVLEIYRSTYSHILIDEFQDTNPLQFEILALLIDGHPRTQNKLPSLPVFFFGDTNQAVYEFMGATPENVDRWAHRFDCDEYTLEINHRTKSPKILQLSSALRSDITTLPPTHRPSLYINPNEQIEATLIKKEIEALSLRLHRICVIAPNRYRLQQIQTKLRGSDPLPFVFIPDFSGSGMEKQFSTIFENLRSLSDDSDTSLSKKIKAELDTLTDDSKKDVLKLMQGMARDYDIRFRHIPISIRAKDFLNHILLEVNWGNLVRQTVKDKIYVSTIHGVKGLQFDHVIICGFENYVMPHSSICVDHCQHGNLRSQINVHVSESKRLLYVGITRSIDDISFYSVKINSKDKKRSVTCLLHPLRDHIQTDADFRSQMCGFQHL